LSAARYGSVHPNQFPLASFSDAFSYVPNEAVSNTSVVGLALSRHSAVKTPVDDRSVR
jgi:hypothetical protein